MLCLCSIRSTCNMLVISRLLIDYLCFISCIISTHHQQQFTSTDLCSPVITICNHSSWLVSTHHNSPTHQHSSRVISIHHHSHYSPSLTLTHPMSPHHESSCLISTCHDSPWLISAHQDSHRLILILLDPPRITSTRYDSSSAISFLLSSCIVSSDANIEVLV